MEFEQLENLQRKLRELKALQTPSLAAYFNSGGPRSTPGFRHLRGKEPTAGQFSHASTATCIASLTTTGDWWYGKSGPSADEPWHYYTERILKRLRSTPPKSWKSAGLGKGNPFTVSFILEGIKELAAGPTDLKANLRREVGATITQAERHLLTFLNQSRADGQDPNQFAEPGGAHIDYYPPTTFLTQLVIRSVGISHENHREHARLVEAWARKQLEHELALIDSGANTRDPLALAYALTILLTVTDSDSLSTVEVKIINRALDCFFACQRDDGLWPRSRPLHHYPKFGNAYCFEYETLAQLLRVPYIEPQLIDKLDSLQLCVDNLDATANALPGAGKAWPSGHHPHVHGAESWSTASVYHFVHNLSRIVAEAIRQRTFEHVGSTYVKPKDHKYSTAQDFAPRGFLDSGFRWRGQRRSLRRTLQDYFLRPILEEVHQVERGASLSKPIPISAILFGPPGTSKTQLAKRISEHLGWPRLDVDPSHLFRGGLEQIQSESNRLFNMLAALERTVVFFDEFDEMVRERTSDRSDLVSRFLTTAMLPKLSRIADERRIVFLLATNRVEDFDFAIRRPGRFDMILPIMPPSLQAKFKHWPEMKTKTERILDESVPMRGEKGQIKYRKMLEALTFDEFEGLHRAIKDIRRTSDIRSIVNDSWEAATLRKPSEGAKEHGAEQPRTYLEFYEDQIEKHTRIMDHIAD